MMVRVPWRINTTTQITATVKMITTTKRTLMRPIVMIIPAIAMTTPGTITRPR